MQQMVRGATTNKLIIDSAPFLNSDTYAPTILTEAEFENPLMIYQDFDHKVDPLKIMQVNTERFNAYLKECGKPLFEKKFTQPPGKPEKPLLEQFKENIADMEYWRKTTPLPVDNMILTFRGHTFWLSNMFPSAIHYSVSDLHNGENILGAVARLQKKMQAMKDTSVPAHKLQYERYQVMQTMAKLIEDANDTFGGKKGLVFPSVEHAYMAQKVMVADLLDNAAEYLDFAKPLNPIVAATMLQKATDAIAMFESIRLAATAKDSKKIANFRGKPSPSSHDRSLFYSSKGNEKSPWAELNRTVMALALAKKCQQLPAFVPLLQKLAEHEIVEGNYFGDDIWGCGFYGAAYARLTNLSRTSDYKYSGVLRNTDGINTFVRGSNWLGRCHMANATTIVLMVIRSSSRPQPNFFEKNFEPKYSKIRQNTVHLPRSGRAQNEKFGHLFFIFFIC